MPNRNNRYKLMERYMGYALTASFLAFLTLMMCSGLDIPWLKLLAAIVAILLPLLCLVYLYLTEELFRQRSLWLSACAAAILVCAVISLILSFPSPNPLDQPNPYTEATTETTGDTAETVDSWYESYFPTGNAPDAGQQTTGLPDDTDIDIIE